MTLMLDALRLRFDHADSMTLTMTAQDPKIDAFASVYGIGPDLGEGTLCLGIRPKP